MEVLTRFYVKDFPLVELGCSVSDRNADQAAMQEKITWYRANREPQMLPFLML
jgi:hypothetical protein